MGDSEPEVELPEGVTQQMVESLVRRVVDACEKIGLYAIHTTHVELHGDRLVLVGDFEIGDIAFTQRVQNPEQAEFDDQFRAIEAESVADQADEIRDMFRRKEPPDGG